MKKLNEEALEAINDVKDEELEKLTGAGGGVINTFTHECYYNSVSPASWGGCCK
ncbi:lacticin 481 family lantibiotic [Clostridium tagluense]|uniref:lacticin 481 family lantibiotic n=1 Tax=Clostridium tagluense TaxID=360422 RepID=UPI001C6F50E5|nr:lacticin 481 family lantibiotic [Clostridium tagluense]MBW9159190.1 type A2 lantipeptide [Clostridium tagluense]WLC68445.1 type A2 lantipeptide [Clostridium tagluense]